MSNELSKPIDWNAFAPKAIDKPRTLLERMRDDAHRDEQRMYEAIREMIARNAGLAINSEGADARSLYKQRAGFLTRMLNEYIAL